MKRYLFIPAACLIAAALAISGCRSPDNSEPQDNIEYTITVDPPSNGRVFAGLDKAEAGTEISLIIRANSGYELTSLTAIPANKVSFTGDGSKRTFIMPDADVRIYAVFDFLPPNFYSVIINGNDVEKGIVFTDKLSYRINDSVTLTLAEEDGYELDTISATAGDALFPIGTRTGDTWTFAMPAVNINVTVSWKEITKYNVNIGNFSGGRVFANPDKAAAGAEISLSIDADNGYQLTSLTVAPADAVSITGTGTMRTFIMPDTDVGIYAVFNLLPPNFYSVIINGNDAEKGAVSADKTAYEANDPVILTLREENGYELDNISATSGGSTFNMGTRTGDTWTFAMPANNVNVTVSWRIIPQYNVNIGSFSGGIVFAGPNPAEQGQTVTLTVTEDAYYTLHSLSTTPDNLGVTAGTRTFIMPPQEVTVNAEFTFNAVSPQPANSQIIEDFENFAADQGGFWTNETAASIPADPHEGAGAMRITHNAVNGAGWHGGAGNAATPISYAGTQWDAITFWVRANNSGAQYRFIVQGQDSGANDSDFNFFFTVDTANTWIKITAPVSEMKNGAGQTLTYTGVGWVIAPVNTPAGWIDIDYICYEGDGPPPPTYNINFSAMNNGSVSARPNPAAAGVRVTLTATADNNGYYLFSLSTTPDNLGVNVNQQTFIMPAQTVTVNAAFTRQTDGGEDGLSIGDIVSGKGRLVWRDEFNGTVLDRTKWNYDNGVGGQYDKWGWGNGERQWYRPENVRVENGYLIIEASGNGSPDAGYPYTSGKIMTAGVREPNNQTVAKPSGGFLGVARGYVEARFRGPKGIGFWPAFWILGANENQYMNPGANYPQYGWPGCCEIDVMETTGGQESHAGQTIHFGAVPYDPGRWRYIYKNYNFPNGQGTGDTFHTYAVKWNTTNLIFYIDGNVNNTINWSEVNIGETSYAQTFYNDIPKVLIFNLAIGGNMGGGEPTQASLTTGPWENRSLTVDWVRVYEEE